MKTNSVFSLRKAVEAYFLIGISTTDHFFLQNFFFFFFDGHSTCHNGSNETSLKFVSCRGGVREEGRSDTQTEYGYYINRFLPEKLFLYLIG
jgi:hypothetical protein